MYDLPFWSVWFCWLYKLHYATDTVIVILFTLTLREANMFYNNCFVKFKIFASTVVFNFQIKAESKDIQLRLLILVLLSNSQKFVGIFHFFILIMFLKCKTIAMAI